MSFLKITNDLVAALKDSKSCKNPVDIVSRLMDYKAFPHLHYQIDEREFYVYTDEYNKFVRFDRELIKRDINLLLRHATRDSLIRTSLHEEVVSLLALTAPLMNPQPNDIIPVKDCFLRINNGAIEKEPAGPAFFNRYSLDLSYPQEKVRPKKFLAFLEKSLEDIEKRDFLYNWLAYLLLPTVARQRALWLLGEGQNGKSVLAQICIALVGRENVSNLKISQLKGFTLSNIVDKVLNITDEVAVGKTFEEETYKALVSGTPVAIDVKYRQPYSYVPRIKMMILMNEAPPIADHTYGFKRRYDILEFNKIIPDDEVDRDLADRIIERELPHIFRGLMERAATLDLGFPQPPIVKQAVERVSLESNPIAIWAEDAVDVSDPAAVTWTDTAYRKYSEWCKEGGFKVVDKVVFSKRLLSLKKGVKVEIRRIAGGSRRVYVGLRLL